MTGYHSKRRRTSRVLLGVLSKALPAALGLAGGLSILLMPRPVSAEQALEWARVDFLRNRVQLVPSQQRARRARISDILGIGDSLRTARSSRAELRFNDGSLARIGERATFRFTPNTRNFQLTNGTALLLIPPERGRSTIQTPNAVTGIQGSALFVRYIPETNTTIVGALTDNPDGPMVLFNRDGSEQQALRANEIGVIEGDQITQLYQFDGELFWQSSGLAEGFNYLNDSSSTGSDSLDAVRQEIRDAIANKPSLDGNNVIENPSSFSLPSPDESPANPTGDTGLPASDSPDADLDTDFVEEGLEEEAPLEFENTPADEYLNSSAGSQEDRNSLEAPQPTSSTGNSDKEPTAGSVGASTGDGGDGETDPEETVVEEPGPVEGVVTEEVNVKPDIAPGVNPSAGASSGGANAGGANTEAPVAGGANNPATTPVTPTVEVSEPGTQGPNNPLAAPTAIMEEEPSMEDEDPEDMGETEGSTPDETPGEGSAVNDGQTPPDEASPTDAEGENQDVTGEPVNGGAVDDVTAPPAESAEDPTGESSGASDPVDAGGSEAPEASNGEATEVEVPVTVDSESPEVESENPLIINDSSPTPTAEEPVTETAAPTETVPDAEPVTETAAPIETVPDVEPVTETAAPIETVPDAEPAPETAAPIETVPVTDSVPETTAPTEAVPDVEPVTETVPATENLVIPADTEVPATEVLVIPDVEPVPDLETVPDIELETVPVNENFLDVSDVVDDPLMTDPMTEMTESMNNSMNNNMDDGDNGNGNIPVTVPNPTGTPTDNPATNGADNPATNGADNPATNGPDNPADNPASPATSGGSDNPAPTDDRPTN